MKEIVINNKNTIVSRFDVQEEFEFSRKSGRKYRISIALEGISRKEFNTISDYLRGDNPRLAFGRFDFSGSISIRVDGFYVNLENVELKSFKFSDKKVAEVSMSFDDLPGFGYTSGFGKSVIREQKLKEILG